MADVYHLPLLTFAERKILDMGDICQKLMNVPLEDLSRVSLTRRQDMAKLTGHDALMNLAEALYQLAGAVWDYEIAQDSKDTPDVKVTHPTTKG